jgi:hypothetical protein
MNHIVQAYIPFHTGLSAVYIDAAIDGVLYRTLNIIQHTAKI